MFNGWPKTILLLPVWARDAKRLDTPGRGNGVTHRILSEWPPEPFRVGYRSLRMEPACGGESALTSLMGMEEEVTPAQV